MMNDHRSGDVLKEQAQFRGQSDDEVSMEFSAMDHSVRQSETLHTSNLAIIQPSADQKFSKAYEDFTVNKLQFNSLGIQGRDAEIAVLNQCFERLISAKKKQLVFISGVSGSGKSLLAASLQEKVRRMKGSQIRAKFESRLRDKPFSGLHLMSREVGRQIKKLRKLDGEKFLQLRAELLEAMGGSWHDLMGSFPALESVMMDDESKLDGSASVLSALTASTRFGGANISLEAKNRFNRASTIFLRVLSKFLYPMVITWDDLQWANSLSLESIDHAIRDRENNNLMIIIAYRSDEIDETHVLSKMKKELQSTEDISCDITEISLGDLGVHAVNKVVQTLLRTDNDGKTFSLAKVCHKKCSGNPHHLMQFLRSLEEKTPPLLEYNFGLMEWCFNAEQIMASTQASQNVTDLLKSQMMQQSAVVQRTLALAAFLGYSFPKSALSLVWKNFSAGDCEVATSKDVEEALGASKSVGFIEAVDSAHFSWAHDAIQEAAFSMTPPHTRARLSARIGKVLSTHLSEDELEDSMFTVVDLLNSDPTLFEDNTEDRIEASALNLRAAQRAINTAAFEGAARFVEHAIMYLPASKWESHYELTLELYSLRAEVAVVIGQHDGLEDCCEEVFSIADKPIIDKLRVYCALIEAKMNLKLHKESMKLCLEALKKFGCRFNMGIVGRHGSVLANWGRVAAVRILVRRKKKIDLDRVPILEDEMKLAQMRLMDKLISCCYLTHSDLMPVVVFRSMKWSLKYGLSVYTPAAVAAVGMLLATMGDFHGSEVLGERAINMLDRIPDGKGVESRTVFVTHTFALHWSRPVNTTLKPLRCAYESGLQSGNIESATFAIMTYIVHCFLMGKPMGPIESDCRIYATQMKQLRRENAAFMTCVLWQTVLNLMGRSDETSLLVGEAFDEEKWESEESAINKHDSLFVNAWRCLIRSYFGQYDWCAGEALKFAKKHELEYSNPGHFSSVVEAFHRALAFFAMAQSGGPRAIIYKIEGKKLAARIKRFKKRGNPNVKHYDAILNAEWAAVNGKTRDAVKFYEKAIILSARSGFLQDAAIASERYSLFLSRDMQDDREAEFRMQESIKFYRSWGAHAKADMLEEKHERTEAPVSMCP